MLLDFKHNEECCQKEISIRDSYGKYLFCEGLDWHVELTELEDEDGFEIEDIISMNWIDLLITSLEISKQFNATNLK